jgi:hypothetical protein
MRTRDFFLVLILSIGVAVSIGYYLAGGRISTKENKLMQAKTHTINADSLRDVIEAKIIDSVKVLLMDQDRKIVDLAKRINTNRRQYENLKKRVDSISVDMPDF